MMEMINANFELPSEGQEVWILYRREIEKTKGDLLYVTYTKELGFHSIYMPIDRDRVGYWIDKNTAEKDFEEKLDALYGESGFEEIP
jgi:hypothetical protein